MKSAAILFLTARVALGAVFIVSGFQKLAGIPENFAAMIEKFEILPVVMIPAFSRALPWIEFLGGVLLALGLWTRAALASLWAMNTAFIFVLASALIRKLPVEQCGCFGEAIHLSPVQMLALDSFFWLLFLALFVTARRVDAPSLDRAFDGRL